MKRLLMVALLALSVPALAADPYGSEYEQSKQAHYQQLRGLFLKNVKVLYFAVGCKVFPAEGSVLPYIYATTQLLREEATDIRIFDAKLTDNMREEAGKGSVAANQPGACDYWRQNPEDLYRVRRLVEAMQRTVP